MSTWILILTLFTDGYNAGGGTVVSAGEFITVESCQEAGNAWLKQMRASNGAGNAIGAHALCVRSDKR